MLTLGHHSGISGQNPALAFKIFSMLQKTGNANQSGNYYIFVAFALELP